MLYKFFVGLYKKAIKNNSTGIGWIESDEISIIDAMHETTAADMLPERLRIPYLGRLSPKHLNRKDRSRTAPYEILRFCPGGHMAFIHIPFTAEE